VAPSPIDANEDEKGGKLTEQADDVEEVKIVDWSTYVKMIKLAGGPHIWAAVLCICIVERQAEFIRDQFWTTWAYE